MKRLFLQVVFCGCDQEAALGGVASFPPSVTGEEVLYSKDSLISTSCFISSMCSDSLSVSVAPSVALRNSDNPFPKDLARSGSLFGPKKSKAIAAITISSGMPMPNIFSTFPVQPPSVYMGFRALVNGFDGAFDQSDLVFQ